MGWNPLSGRVNKWKMVWLFLLQAEISKNADKKGHPAQRFAHRIGINITLSKIKQFKQSNFII